MASFIEAVFLGIVQGITEWLPVSSSGHLVIVQELFNMQQPLVFDILLHFGTLLVIFMVFWRDIIKVLQAIFRLHFRGEYGKLAIYILIGSVATAVIGIIFRDLFASFFASIRAVSIALLVTGTLLYLTKSYEKRPGAKKITPMDSIIMGIAQGIAIIPGVSRSGATISAGLLRGIRKEKLITFSFLLSIPAIIGALIMEFDASLINQNLFPYIIGTLTATIIGYFSLKFLIKIILKNRFHVFSYYCFIVGIVFLVYSFF